MQAGPWENVDVPASDPTTALIHRLPPCLWRVVLAYTYSAERTACDEVRVLNMLRLVSACGCAIVRNVARRMYVAVGTISPHWWVYARWPTLLQSPHANIAWYEVLMGIWGAELKRGPRSNAWVRRARIVAHVKERLNERSCCACGTATIPITTTTLRWEVVESSQGRLKHVENDLQTVRACTACLARCTLTAKQARTWLMGAAVELNRLGSHRHARCDTPSSRQMVLFEEPNRYLKWNLYHYANTYLRSRFMIETIPFTTHRSIVWSV